MRVTNSRQFRPDQFAGDQPEILWGTAVPDGDAEPQAEAPIGSIYLRMAASNVGLYQKTADNNADADWVKISGAFTGTTGFIPVSLGSLWEVSSNAIVEPLKTGSKTVTVPVPLSDLYEVTSNAIAQPLKSNTVTKRISVPLASLRETSSNDIINASGIGGILSKDSTPNLEFTNGDTDAAIRLDWAASNSDPVTFQTVIPEDYDEGSVITFNVLAAMAGATDTPVLNLDTHFDTGDTQVADATGAVTGTTPAVYTATIAAADIPASAYTVSIEITPAAHTSDVLYVYALWLEYTVEGSPKLSTVNGDTDGALAVTWAAADVTPVAFQVPVPADYDEGSVFTVSLYAEMGGASDTPAISLDTYFDVGDTKVEDDTAALANAVAVKTATIAAADIPASAQTMTIEMTPGAHNSDSIILYSVSFTYTVEASPKLQYANGDTDSGFVVTWAAGDVTPVAFQVPLSPDLDDTAVVEVHLRAKSGSTNDTPIFSLDSYFNEGDTKVEDDTAAVSSTVAELTGTIAAADVPAGAQVLTVELTPAAHDTDTLVVSGVWVEYSKV